MTDSNELRMSFLQLTRNSSLGRFGGMGTLAIFLLVTSGISVAGQELGIEPNQTEMTAPDLADGKAIAEKLCVGCHLIDKTSDGGTPADVPSFPSIANRSKQSVEGLTNWLLTPHPPMPDAQLTRQEIRDLAGYIISLRTARENQ